MFFSQYNIKRAALDLKAATTDKEIRKMSLEDFFLFGVRGF